MRSAPRDRLQHRREDAVAVDQQLDLAALVDRVAGERLGGAHEVGRVGVDPLDQLVAEGALAAVAEAVARVPGEPGAAPRGGADPEAAGRVAGGGRGSPR